MVRRGGMSRVKTSESEEKRRLVEEWDRSGLTSAEFATSRGIQAATLQTWGRAIRGPLRRRSRKRPVPRTLEIVEVGSPARSVEPRIEIILQSGGRLVVFAEWSPERVAQFVAQLELRG